MSEEAVFAESRPNRRWQLPFVWVGLLAIACVIYELTQSPALGSVLVCLKFGWDDFLTARWLWRCDPHLGRRRATFWLYLAWGLWKTALVAFGMSVAFALVTPGNVPAGVPQALRAFAGTFLLTLLALGLSTLATGLAVLWAWCAGARLWLGSGVHRARRNDDWPPTPWCRGRKNCLGHVVLTAVGVTCTVLLLACVIAATALGGAARAVSFPLTVCVPVLLLISREAIYRHVWADRPEECWPEPAEEP